MPRKPKIPKNNKYFTYTNPNPEGKHTIDCTVRAISIAFGISWYDAYDLLATAGKMTHTIMDAKESIHYIMDKTECTRVSFAAKKGTKRPTLRTVAKQLPNETVIGQLSHHIACMVNGVTKDVWDSSDRPLYTYWVVEPRNKEKLKNLQNEWELNKKTDLLYKLL